MRKNILFITFLIFLISNGVLLSSPEKKEFEDFNIRKVEENITKVKKELKNLNSNISSLEINIKRDPFLPLLEKVEWKKQKKRREKTLN